MGYWRNSEWRKCQGTENVSQDGRGNLWAEGLTGDVAFSPGTQPMHGDLTGREHRKKKLQTERYYKCLGQEQSIVLCVYKTSIVKVI